MTINKQAQAIISDIRLKHGSDDFYAPIIRWDEFKVITGALEAADKRIAELEAREVILPAPTCTYADHSYPAYSELQVVALLGSLGIITKVGE